MAEDPEQRIAALAEYGVMDTPEEQVFDDLTRLTSFICGTPIALITLLDQERQWFKSKVGIDASETPLDQAFCAHAIEDEKVFLVPDAAQDKRFAKNPLVTGKPNIRFYAGAPLRTSAGVALGTLCAIDRVPRVFSEAQVQALEALARQVMWALEYRKTSRLLTEAEATKERALDEVQTLQDLLPMCAWCRKVRDDEDFWHDVEHYLGSHRDIHVTHGICPECVAKVESENTPSTPD